MQDPVKLFKKDIAHTFGRVTVGLHQNNRPLVVHCVVL